MVDGGTEAIRKSSRLVKPREFYEGGFAAFLAQMAAAIAPVHYKDVLNRRDRRQWEKPMDAEMFIILYVDDLLIISEDDDELVNLKRELSIRFEMKDLGEVKRFLGMEIEHGFDGVGTPTIKIHQADYIRTLLQRHGMEDCNPVSSPMDPSVNLTATMALTDAAKEIKWIRILFDELHFGITPRPSTILRTDNQGALALAKNPVHHTRSKHIDIKYHYIRETIAQGIVWLEHVSTSDKAADFLTKPLGRVRHQKCLSLIGMQ